MSLVVTLSGNDGIVMAGDSRAVFNKITLATGKKELYGYSNIAYKVVLGKGRIGVSAVGNGTIDGTMLDAYIESFFNELPDDVDIKDVPQLLFDYFKPIPETNETMFQIAGYTKQEGRFKQKIWLCMPDKFCSAKVKNIIELAPGYPFWLGQTDVLSRLTNPGYTNSYEKTVIPYGDIPYHTFSLKQMIEFAVFMIRTTAGMMKFRQCEKGVGGHVDVLVIKPEGAYWASRKKVRNKSKRLRIRQIASPVEDLPLRQAGASTRLSGIVMKGASFTPLWPDKDSNLRDSAATEKDLHTPIDRGIHNNECS